MNKVRIFLILFTILNQAIGQQYDSRCDHSNLVGYKVSKMRYTEFSPEQKFYLKNKSKQDFNNSTPIDLVKSMLNPKDKKISFEKGTEDYLKNNSSKELDFQEEDFIQFMGEIDLTINNEEYSLLGEVINAKFPDGKDFIWPVVLTFRKDKQKGWISTDRNLNLSGINTLFFMNAEYIAALFENNTNLVNDGSETDIKWDSLIVKSWENGSFDLENFSLAMGNLMLGGATGDGGNPFQNNLKIKENKVIDVKVSGINPFRNQEYCTYFKNLAENELVDYFPDLMNIAKSSYNSDEKIEIVPIVSYKINASNFEQEEKAIPRYYFKFIARSEGTIENKVVVLDEKFNIIDKNDTIFNLLQSKTQDELDEIFLRENNIIFYEDSIDR